MNNNVAIFNFWFSQNFGAVLTAWALYKTIKKLGFNPYIINYNNKAYMKHYKLKRHLDFAKKFLNITQECNNKDDLKKLNKDFNTFIVGSDQVWQWFDWWNYLYYLDFVSDDKKKIACSVSFGSDEYRGNKLQTQIAKHFVKKFDAVSCREYSGVNICKNVFNIDSQFVIDPVFMLEPNEYDEIIDNSNLKDKNYTLAYILDLNEEKENYIKNLENNKIIRITKNTKVEDFLYYFKNADFVITDSFHGSCFSIIFNKQFKLFRNIERGNARFDTLLEITNINNTDLPNINWDDVNNNLSILRKSSIKWIYDALTRNKEIKPASLLDELFKEKYIDNKYLRCNTPKPYIVRALKKIIKILKGKR